MKLCLLTAAACLAACTCTPLPGPEPVEPPVPDAGADAAPVPVDDCVAAGATLERLQCRDELGAPLWQGPNGESFSDACQRLIGAGVPWDAACIARIASCTQYNQAATGELCSDGGVP